MVQTTLLPKTKTKKTYPKIKGSLQPPEPVDHNFGTKVTLLVDDRDMFLSDDPEDFNTFLENMEKETVKWTTRNVHKRSGNSGDDPDDRLLLWKIKAKDAKTGKTFWNNKNKDIPIGKEVAGETDLPSTEDLLEIIKDRKNTEQKTKLKKGLEKIKDIKIEMLPVNEKKTLAKLNRYGKPVYWKNTRYVPRTIPKKVKTTGKYSKKEKTYKDSVPELIDYDAISATPELLSSFKSFLSRRNRRINTVSDDVRTDKNFEEYFNDFYDAEDLEKGNIRIIEEKAPFICALDDTPKIRLMGPVDLMQPLAKAVVALIDGDVDKIDKIVSDRTPTKKIRERNRLQKIAHRDKDAIANLVTERNKLTGIIENDDESIKKLNEQITNLDEEIKKASEKFGGINKFPYYLPRVETEGDDREGMLTAKAVALSRLYVNKAERDPDGKFCSDTIRVYINPESVEGESSKKLLASLKKGKIFDTEN